MYGWEDRFFNRIAMVTQTFPFLPLVDGGETKFQVRSSVANVPPRTYGTPTQQRTAARRHLEHVFSFRVLDDLYFRDLNGVVRKLSSQLSSLCVALSGKSRGFRICRPRRKALL